MNKKSALSVIVLLLVLTLPLLFLSVQADRAMAALNGHANVYVAASRPDNSGDGLSWATAKKTIQAGIDIVDTGGIVHVAAGTYYEHNIHIYRSFDLEGAGALSTIIDGGELGQVIIVASYIGQTNTISGFTIQNGYIGWRNRVGEAGTPTGPGMPVGGGVYVAYGHVLILNDCAIINNRADFMGGGIYNAGKIQLNRCTLSGNSAGTYGGGIANFMDKPDNEAPPDAEPAPPVRLEFNGTMSMVNCTVSGNSISPIPAENITAVSEQSIVSGESLFSVMPEAMGGGIFNGGYASFMNVTIANNTISGLFATNIVTETADNLTPVPVFLLPRGGGFANVPLQCANDEGAPMDEPTAIFKNTIVANNLPDNGFSFKGKTNSMGYNLDSENTCGFHQYTDQINTNPLLGPLQNNGGPTSTLAITADSPAYNTGSSSDAPPTDQRGIKRPQHFLYDIGAYEYAGALPRTQQFSFKKSDSSSEIENAQSSSGSMSTRPFLTVQLPNLTVQSASLSSSTAEPNAPITVTAVISNMSTVNGTKTVKVHVNGQEDAATGVAVDSGQTRAVTFTVSRSEPGTYQVYVDGASAGSFEVRDSAGPTLVLVLSIAAILGAAVLCILYMMRRRQNQF